MTLFASRLRMITTPLVNLWCGTRSSRPTLRYLFPPVVEAFAELVGPPPFQPVEPYHDEDSYDERRFGWR